jgi:hypothetical protein
MTKTLLQRYSESLPQELQQKVRRIGARHGSFFRTREIALAQEGAPPLKRWAEARKNPQTGLWTVRQYRKQSDYMKRDQDGGVETGGALAQSTLLSGVCYFDALRACAEFEAADMAIAGEAPGKEELAAAREALGKEYFRTFAEAEGTVFDVRDGLPLPVLDGEILAEDCMLDENAQQIAKRAAGNAQEAPPVSAASLSRDLVAVPEVLPLNNGASTGAALTAFGSVALAQNITNRRHSTLDRLSRALEDAQMVGFRKFGFRRHDGSFDGGGLVVASKVSGAAAMGLIATAFILPPAGAIPLCVIGFIGGISSLVTGLMSLVEKESDRSVAELFSENGWVRSESKFKKKLKAVRRMGQALPTEEMREAASQCADQIELGYRMLTARAAFERAMNNRGITAPVSRFRMNREVARFTKRASALGTSEEKINQALAAMQQSGPRGDFNYTVTAGIKSQIRTLEKIVEAAQGQTAKKLAYRPS